MTKSVYSENGAEVTKFYVESLKASGAEVALSETVKKFDLKKRSVISFLSSVKGGKVYKSVAKSSTALGGSRVQKIHLVREVASLLGVSVDSIESMEKMTKSQIETLKDNIVK